MGVSDCHIGKNRSCEMSFSSRILVDVDTRTCKYSINQPICSGNRLCLDLVFFYFASKYA